MKRNLHPLSILLTTVTCAVLALTTIAQAQEKKADPTGTWTWSMQGREGGTARATTLKLKTEGEKLLGTVTTPGRQGADPRQTEIENGKVKGDEISFAVTREFGGNKMVSKYTGKVTGDAIKGKIEFERDGQTQTRDWEAKRVAPDKK